MIPSRQVKFPRFFFTRQPPTKEFFVMAVVIGAALLVWTVGPAFFN